MRRPILTVCVILLAASAAALGAQTDKPRTPKKGDVLVIKGCLRGSAVEGAQAMTVDAEGAARTDDTVPALTYRLQGKKDLLRELKDKHDRMVVEVKGILRSSLSGSGIGKDVGRTRIRIGVDPRAGSASHGSDEAVPVLEATSFTGTTIGCGR